MDSFEFFGVNRVVFGRGTIARAGELAAGLGKNALVIHNGPSAEALLPYLSSAGVKYTVRRQRGEPTVPDVDAALDESRRAGCDCVIGLGGGSAIDTGKAIAGLLGNGGVALDYMEIIGQGKKITRPAFPWMAIPTTAGAGAEATRNAVIGFPEKKFKASIRSELLLARIALVDSDLARNLPPNVVASSGMDALCQLIESYTSIGASPITDALALQGMRLASRALPRVFHHNEDEARLDMALAALLGGVTLTSAGLGAVHGFAAPIGANFPVPHGAVCAALLPPIISANIAALRRLPRDDAQRGLQRYATIGRQLPGGENADDETAISYCIAFTERLLADLKIPKLRGFGLRESSIPEMVVLARKASSTKFNPVNLDDDALSAALAGAIGSN